MGTPKWCHQTLYSDKGRNDHNHKDHSQKSEKDYTFNGRVLIGIGIILAVAAGSTLSIMSISKSPQIHLSGISVFSSLPFFSSSTSSIPSWVSEQSSSTPNTATATATVQEDKGSIDRRFVLVQQDFGWNGTTGGPTIRVNKGDRVQIVVINAGLISHNFGMASASNQTLAIMKDSSKMSLPERIKAIPYNAMAQMPCPDCDPKFKQGHIETFMKPDTQQVTIFTANEAGNFKYFCMVRGHLWLGMVGDLIVEEPPSTGSAQQQKEISTTAGGNV